MLTMTQSVDFQEIFHKEKSVSLYPFGEMNVTTEDRVLDF